MEKESPMFLDDKVHITFDDVALATGFCEIDSRSDVDVTSNLPGDFSLELPVMTAAMDTITSVPMAKAIIDEGGAIVHHRNQSLEARKAQLSELSEHRRVVQKNALNGTAVGTGVTPRDVDELIDAGANLIGVEVAHAYMGTVAETVREIGPVCKDRDALLMVGNFSRVDAIEWLADSAGEFVDLVKVSQGGGSCCTTRVRTGIGKPTLQAVIDLVEADTPFGVIADGGIRTSGALAKALAAGASAGMLGGMLSGTDETPGELIYKDDVAYKQFRGMASRDAKEDAPNDEVKNVEGISTLVPYQGSVTDIFDQIRDGLQSSIASTGFESLSTFQKRAQFIRLSRSSQIESLPHAEFLQKDSTRRPDD
jgi:IMP dehydrogenase